MTASEALVLIRGYAAANRIVLTSHASERASQRGATYQDVRCALMSSLGCAMQSNGRWKTSGGVDVSNEELQRVVEVDRGVIVITLF